MRRKKIISLFLAFLIFATIAPKTAFFADSFGDFTYAQAETVTLTGYIGAGGAVVVPESVNGKPVTAVGDFVFDKKLSITSISLPQTLTSIGECAFRACRGLSVIEIPSSVTQIGFYAFDLCENLTIRCYRGSAAHDYALRYSVNFELIDASGDDEFEYTTTASEATLTRYIGNGGEVSIPYTLGGRPVTTIGPGAFAGCERVSAVYFTETVMAVKPGAFDGCTGLKSFSVEDISRFFAVKDGILYSKDFSKLVCYPQGRSDTELVLAMPVEEVCNSAFRGAKNLQSLTFDESLRKIGHYAFADCTKLSAVNLGSTPEYVGTGTMKNTAWFAMQADGALYSTGVLLGFKGELSGDFTVEKGTKTVAAYTFAGTEITSVVLPESLNNLCDHAFYNTPLTALSVFSEKLAIGEAAVATNVAVKCPRGTPVYDYFSAAGNPTEPLLPDTPLTVLTYASSHAVYITWNAVDGADSYIVYKNGEQFATTQNTHYCFTDFSSPTAFMPTVSAVKNGVEGKTSKPFIAAVPATFVGDIDGNGRIELSDAMRIFLHVSGKDLLEPPTLGDVNADGKTELSDAMVVFLIVAGKIDLT